MPEPARTRLGPGEAEVYVYTFKEGLLSPVAHDLKLRAAAFEIAVEGEKVRASFDPARIEVVSAMRDGRPDPEALSAHDRAEIERNIRRSVLEVERYPEIRFEGTFSREGESAEVYGQLHLHGVTRPVSLSVHQSDGELLGQVRLDQRDFAITPFRALMGALKIKPEVEVELRLPAALLSAAGVQTEARGS
ncbi:MAG: YceI family protein [Deltaproteobacteria bacterium]|nr:MAG: YceI family protein [Deltaproteobacteria bacterium]